MKKILIVGATSAIAEACARQWAQRGDSLALIARGAGPLQAIHDDLKARGAHDVFVQVADPADTAQQTRLLESAVQALGGLDIFLLAYGSLSDQARAQEDAAYALSELHVNANSAIGWLTLVSPRLERQGHGHVVVISSVAGDRGRQSNYVYGSAKAMLSAFLSGLRQRLAKSGVQVLTVKPGFVDTPMTAHLPKGALWARPADVARDIVRAIDQGRHVLYTPRFWALIMGIIKHIPERIFVKLKL